MNGKELKDMIKLEREEALRKAMDSLSRYKFLMFGYWAASWVKLNSLLGDEKKQSPFAALVRTAKEVNLSDPIYIDDESQWAFGEDLEKMVKGIKSRRGIDEAREPVKVFISVGNATWIYEG